MALPLLFVVLQAIFPQLGAGSWQGAFSALPRLFADDALLAMGLGTLQVGLGVTLGSLIIGLPLGALRGLFRLPGGALWDLLFLVPFLTPPYIAALNWTLRCSATAMCSSLPASIWRACCSAPAASRW